MKKLFSFSLIFAFVFFAFGHVHAALTGTTVITETVVPGVMTISSVPTASAFGAITLNGSSQNTTSDLNSLNVQDFTGAGSGWNVTASASQFTTGSNTIPTGSLLLKKPTSVTAVTTGGVVPSTIMASNGTIDGSSIKVISAAANEGMGEFQVNFPASTITLALPATIKVGTYTSTITWTLSVGP